MPSVRGSPLSCPIARPQVIRRVLIQTLAAGDAYLSQSSKWLHFGIGQATGIRQVTVRWPNGNAERFEGIQPEGRYTLVEGSGQAQSQHRDARSIALQPSTQPAVEGVQDSRTYFSNRLPLPLLPYKSLESGDVHLVETSRTPKLLTLWASWCGPCLAELQMLTQQADRLQKAGIQVLALTVDGVDPTQASQPDDAKALLDQLQFPFDRGIATRETLDKLIVSQSLMFNHQQGLVVPTSWLLDANGDVAVVYQGKLDLDQLLKDVQHLDASLRTRRDLAVPLAGRWLSPPRQLLLRAVARIFQEQGYEDDYARYLHLDTEMLQRHRALATSDADRQQFDTQFATASFNLGLQRWLRQGKPLKRLRTSNAQFPSNLRTSIR